MYYRVVAWFVYSPPICLSSSVTLSISTCSYCSSSWIKPVALFLTFEVRYLELEFGLGSGLGRRRRRLDLRDPHREPHALHLAGALGADGVERAALMALKAPKLAVDLRAFGSEGLGQGQGQSQGHRVRGRVAGRARARARARAIEDLGC